MVFLQNWQGARIHDGKVGAWFPATVPGNIQEDYGKANGFPDHNFGDNCKLYEALEDDGWLYRTEVIAEPKAGERVFFVTKGIEYEYEVRLNGNVLAHHEGMFSALELDITQELQNGNALEVYIYPHPKRAGADVCRDQADQSCKPAVGYNWDWHPRMLVSGLWDDTYIETRGSGYITYCDATYELDKELKNAVVTFAAEGAPEFELYDPDGRRIYKGTDREVKLENIRLWWCAGQGEQALYRWRAYTAEDEKTGTIGFRRVKLVMNGGAWEIPFEFPKSRSTPPITIELNGRRIFAKGSNWVNPEIFNGRINREIYETQLKLVKEANMNILRCWGGAIIDKEPFFELCDELGIMVWQEFPLACNNYLGTKSYLAVLEQEATAIIKRLRKHPCLTLWCGGNELFNNWSKMTDQSFALRLLNKLCYELDWNTPFIPTAPVMGMGHGHYAFLDLPSGQTVFEMFRKSSCTAYSEFGVPSIASMEIIKEIIPADIIETPMPNSPWETHKGYGSWNQAGEDSWLCMYAMDQIFGKQSCMEDYVDKSNWLQCEGLKCIFEEARRQKPHCSMALNWCFNEPWNNVAGPVIVAYPCRPKPAYYAVKEALRSVMPSAGIPYFRWESGSLFHAELWLLNDSTEAASAKVDVYLEVKGQKQKLITWETGCVPAGENKRGHVIQALLPETDTQEEILLTLESEVGSSSYRLLLQPKVIPVYDPHALNV